MAFANAGFGAMARVLVTGALAMALAACGGGESDGGSAASGGGEGAGDAAAAGPANLINGFTFHAPDTVPLKAELVTTELSMTGGCTKDSPMSIGFRQGMPSDEGYFSFSFDSIKPVVAGQKGDIDLENVTWDNGAIMAQNPTEESADEAPVRMEGIGILTIEQHTGVGMNGHMSGIITAEVEGPEGGVPVGATFDINLACAK